MSRLVIAWLLLYERPIYGATVDTGWCTRLHAVGMMSRRYETLREAVASRLRDASTWDHRPAEVHQPSEESPSRDDHLRSCKGHAQLRHY